MSNFLCQGATRTACGWQRSLLRGTCAGRCPYSTQQALGAALCCWTPSMDLEQNDTYTARIHLPPLKGRSLKNCFPSPAACLRKKSRSCCSPAHAGDQPDARTWACSSGQRMRQHFPDLKANGERVAAPLLCRYQQNCPSPLRRHQMHSIIQPASEIWSWDKQIWSNSCLLK